MLEIKRLELQKMKIECAKQEMVYKILEKEEDIKRLEENILNQDKALATLDIKLKEIQGE